MLLSMLVALFLHSPGGRMPPLPSSRKKLIDAAIRSMLRKQYGREHVRVQRILEIVAMANHGASHQAPAYSPRSYVSIPDPLC